MKSNKQDYQLASANSFESRLAHARMFKQNVLIVKWVVFAVSVTLLLLYFLSPIRDIMFVS
jgi:hypothetical protein